ncbi:hypothetical protein RRG08_027448 [Elysia crispata]|uniref:Uncharacterized protein n=1 Tax=Elysia crispata TaxID=231223 RepID=A0AAE0YS91_9GAST|nr:hypothetical protein RRG08_027448 [Elysia crispata]
MFSVDFTVDLYPGIILWETSKNPTPHALFKSLGTLARAAGVSMTDGRVTIPEPRLSPLRSPSGAHLVERSGPNSAHQPTPADRGGARK